MSRVYIGKPFIYMYSQRDRMKLSPAEAAELIVARLIP